ncbi:hypothetical protein KIN20_033493 [Parelaphostrongylus tenuis]|uniref:Uncharacterized protein n=1 Tax=Parelaphostrongylus tenuis TaxID=148309 RepID=A0AAD5WIG8_PARTN|nr:hypothetical protein KIN20_033493 [Parelaphostrongylus tenuis]
MLEKHGLERKQEKKSGKKGSKDRQLSHLQKRVEKLHFCMALFGERITLIMRIQ